MADADAAPPVDPPPAAIHLAPSHRTSRRLSLSHSRPVPVPAAAPGRLLSLVSLKGVLVGAEEASSPAVVGRGLSSEQSAAWTLFTPMQRLLLVAIVAAATADVDKCRRTSALRRPLKDKDEVLMNMSRRLDYLCQEVNSWKEQQLLPFSAGEIFQCGLSSCGCRFQSPPPMNRLSLDSKMMSGLYEEVGMEQREERRMSALSDWNSSTASASEIQLSTLALEQDVFILQKDCDQKEATIKELLDLVKCADAAGSKRISELEDIIKRKNLLINKLKKDVDVLEQKVVNLTRLRRPSHLQSVTNAVKAPVMSSNLLYDMESSPNPSDSDSSSPIGGKQSKVTSNKSHHLDDDKENTLQHNLKENSAVSMQKSPNRQGKKPLGNLVKGKVLTQNCGSSTFSNSRDVSSSSGGLKIGKRHSVQSLHKGCS